MNLRDELLAEAEKQKATPPIPKMLDLLLNRGSALSLPNTYWGDRFRNINSELPHGRQPLEELMKTGSLTCLSNALDNIQIIAPMPSKVFRSLSEIPLSMVNVVFLGQDPYPTADRSKDAVTAINKLSKIEIEGILGYGYEDWSLACPDTRGRITRIPYAQGKSFAYPAICTEPPVSYQNLRNCAITSIGKVRNMDPELMGWSKQGVLMMNSCPLLYTGSSHNPNIWTAWTCEILKAIAIANPYCVFVLLGKTAGSFKSIILKARSIACVIETGHPSSRNSRIGDFMNSDVFKRINEFRTNLDLSQIIW